MNEIQESIYQEGYSAFSSGEPEHSNPYSELDAEYWSDGWEDGKEDQSQQ